MGSPGKAFLLLCSALLSHAASQTVANQGWSSWTSWGACSRTCESGVRSRQRTCQAGSRFCAGKSKEFGSCNTMACPADATDFRVQQCAAFNSRPFRGYFHRWIPYTQIGNNAKCALYCEADGFGFYARLANKVVDGTRFSKDTFDICVDGQRMSAGCDGVLNSGAVLDPCGVCNGDNSTCDRYCGKETRSYLNYGYNRIVTIPKGADNIQIEEIVSVNNNYFGIKRNANNNYFLNGNYRIELPGRYDVAGASCTYERMPYMTEKLSCTGRLTEAIDIMILYQTINFGIQYCYALPKTVGQTKPLYSWYVSTRLTSCSASCGGGHRHRPVSCVSSLNGHTVDRSFCNAATKPSAEKQPCGNLPCPPTWSTGNWSSCTAQCGYGEQTRRVQCVQKLTRSYTINPMADIMCRRGVDGSPKPSTERKCYAGRLCTSNWSTGNWSACSSPCGNGQQTRVVTCNGSCDARAKPVVTKSCNMGPCRWRTGSWSRCSVDCGYGIHERTVSCGSSISNPAGEQYCRGLKKPDSQKQCYKGHCKAPWTVGSWSKCSATCGPGDQTRLVKCRVVRKNNVHTVCDHAAKPNDTRGCQMRDCPSLQTKYDWFASPWSECSVTCGYGVQARTVNCVRTGGAIVHDGNCSAETKPPATQECRKVQTCAFQWLLGSWSDCSTTCGVGFQQRTAACLYIGEDGSSTLMADSHCHESKPAIRKNCTKGNCIDTTWHSRCESSCNPVKEVRSVCASNDAVLSDEQCGPLPESLEVCSPEGCQSNYARAVALHYLEEKKEEKEEEEAPEPERQPKPKSPTAQENRGHESESVPTESAPTEPCPNRDQSWCRSYKTFCGKYEIFRTTYCCNMCRSIMLVG